MSLHQPKADPTAMPMQTRLAPIGTFDPQKRTVEVVFTSGAAVRRRRFVGWDTSIPFDEILTVSRDAVDLSRLNSGAPVLDSHSTFSTYCQVGVVESARIEGNNGIANIRFPSKGVDETSDRLAALVGEGIVRNISVGYIVNEVRVETPDKAGEVEKRIVTRWTPYEISWVTVPADAEAQVRSADAAATFPLIVTRADIIAANTADVRATAARMRMRQLAG